MDMVSFIKQVRCGYRVQALTAVDSVMGIPMIRNNVWYLPFFKILDLEQCALSAEIWMEYPSGAVLKYRRLRKEKAVYFDAKRISKLKKEFNCRLENNQSIEAFDLCARLPEGFLYIYKAALEEMENDEY